MTRWRLAWLLAALVIAATGLARIRFSTDILNLLPADAPGLQALRLWEAHFSSAHELRVTLSGDDPSAVEDAARRVAEGLLRHTNLVTRALWRPVWLDDANRGAELLAWRWMNAPPEAVRGLAARLSGDELETALEAARDRLQFTMSPDELAVLGHDPLGLTRLPGDDGGFAEEYARGERLFSSEDGRFRVVVVEPAVELRGYAEAGRWVESIREITGASLGGADNVRARFTGGPAIASETAADMEADLRSSALGTAVFVLALFGFVHRRWLPLAWLGALLALVLVLTLGIAGWVLRDLHLVSLGFASILLGMAADYGLVLHQEAVSSGAADLRAVSRIQVRPIGFSAGTTAGAFLLLNLVGVPGLGQLATLVAIGMLTAAVVMLTLYVQPFVVRGAHPGPSPDDPAASRSRPRPGRSLLFSVAVGAAAVAAVAWRPPAFEGGAETLRPGRSESYAAMDELEARMDHERSGVMVIVSGADDSEVARRIEAVREAAESLRRAGTVERIELPDALWPQPARWRENLPVIASLATRLDEISDALDRAGFTDEAAGLARGVFRAWTGLARHPEPPPPPGATGSWAWNQVAARDGERRLALGRLRLAEGASAWDVVRTLEAQGSRGVAAGAWEALGPMMREVTLHRVVPVILVVAAGIVLAMASAFRNWKATLLGAIALAWAGCLTCGVMALAGWSWDLMNMMAVALLFGTGVDYSIHQTLSLMRHRGRLAEVRHTTGRALWLCGLTTVAGFTSLALSSSGGLASLGRVCALGVGSALITAQWFLPAWWIAIGSPGAGERAARRPSRLYGGAGWRFAVAAAGVLPEFLLAGVTRAGVRLYAGLRPARRGIVERNLEPIAGSPVRARAMAHEVFGAFARKLVDTWRHEAGRQPDLVELQGGERLRRAIDAGRGALLVTLHLGNWELGTRALGGFGRRVAVVTGAEPDGGLTRARKEARRAQGVDTIVVGAGPFAGVEIVRRLAAGDLVAVLIDRPGEESSMESEFFGRTFRVSRAPLELARATGCAVVPVYVVRAVAGYRAEVLEPVEYERGALRDPARGREFLREILRAFEPVVRQHATQWFHFVDVWGSVDGHG